MNVKSAFSVKHFSSGIWCVALANAIVRNLSVHSINRTFGKGNNFTPLVKGYAQGNDYSKPVMLYRLLTCTFGKGKCHLFMWYVVRIIVFKSLLYR